MTKEPKLQAAVRIVAEWTDYDQEIKRLQTRVQEGANHSKKQDTGTEPSQQLISADKPSASTILVILFLSSCQMFTRSCERSKTNQRFGLCLKNQLDEEVPPERWGRTAHTPETKLVQTLVLLFL
ncbi:hypothetical protein ILYODFUR_005803 [Ilyodon furcidens]|uniref:Uncharacterized protein n=1 Tax=Ilyodon furcidens TaxID=33524 RepID=A0ABV0V3A4_9TELE